MEFFILLSKIINEQGGKLRAGWKENLKNLSEHALLLGTSEYEILSIITTNIFYLETKFEII